MTKTIGVCRLNLGGIASFTLGDADMSITIVATIDDFYYITFTVSGLTAGGVVVSLGGSEGTARTSNATFTETLRVGSRDSLIVFTGTADFDGSLDNVTVEKVTSIDDLTSSLDSRVYAGGEVTLAAFDELSQMGFFTGTAMDATIITGEGELFPGRKTQLNGYRSIIDGGTVTAQVGVRNTQKETIVFDLPQTPDDNSRISARTHKRYHSFRWNITGDFTQAPGMDITSRDMRPGAPR